VRREHGGVTGEHRSAKLSPAAAPLLDEAEETLHLVLADAAR